MNGFLAGISGFAAAAASIIGLGLALWSIRKMNAKLESFEELGASMGQLLRYEESEEGEVMLDTRLVKIIDALGSRVASSMKMSILGQRSGDARLEKGLKAAMTKDIVEREMPLLKLVSDFLGYNTKEYIEQNPDAILQLGQILAPYAQRFMGKPQFNSTKKDGGVFSLG